MESLNRKPPRKQQPLRAVVEIDGGELKVYPIADNDLDERRILDGLRFVQDEFHPR